MNDLCFETTITPLIPGLRTYALSLTRNAVDADDVVQDTLERALRFWPAFQARPGTTVRAWLHVMLYRLVCNRYHRTTRDRKHTADATTFDEQGDLRADVARLDAMQVLTPALEALPAAWREVLERADLRGEAYADIAAAMNTPIGTVMSRLHRARKALHTAVAEPASAPAIEVVDLSDEPRRAPLDRAGVDFARG